MITQGKWAADVDDKTCVRSEDGYLVADCEVGLLQKPKEEQESNAALIAAAPELLAACKAMIKAFDVPQITKLNDERLIRLRSLQKAEGAIAKAEESK